MIGGIGVPPVHAPHSAFKSESDDREKTPLASEADNPDTPAAKT